MKRVSTSALVPGMVVAEDVYTFNNQLVFPKGLVLTDKAITRMEFYSILYVRVEDQVASAAAKPEPTTLSYSEKVKATPEFKQFKAVFEKDINMFKGAINDVVEKGAPLNPELLMTQTMALISNSDGYVNIFDMLHNMREYDDSTYVHCVNVALICNVFGRWLKLSDDDIKTATLSGLLHDIGKLMIPDAIVKKPGKLTDAEYRIIKTHPQEGYKILGTFPIDKHIKNAALMHHERCDGTGYPYGLSGTKIDVFTKMVTIADVYDAMTSARIYRGPLCPFIVISVFENEGLQKYDTRLIMTFLENIVNTYLLNRVRLNNGKEGDIIFINRSHLSSPTIKCGNEYINLSLQKDLFIEAIV